MSKALIKLLYRQVINYNSKDSFEKSVWKASYDEFLLKSQAYNLEKQYTTFQQMAANDGRANSLHYKCGFAAAGYIEMWQKKIPQLKDVLDKPVAFDTYEFKVIDSDITRIEAHQVAIHYITGTLIYYDSIGHHLLLSATNDTTGTSPADTFMLEMQPNLSIISYQPL